MEVLDTRTLRVLMHTLPKLIHLKAFSVTYFVGTELRKPDLMHAIQRNGSLDFVIVDQFGFYLPSGHVAVPFKPQRPFFTDAEKQHVLYTCRNERLPVAIIEPRLDDSDTKDSKYSVPISGFPKLFHVAMVSPGTGPTHCPAGLLSLHNGIGPQQDEVVQKLARLPTEDSTLSHGPVETK